MFCKNSLFAFQYMYLILVEDHKYVIWSVNIFAFKKLRLIDF